MYFECFHSCSKNFFKFLTRTPTDSITTTAIPTSESLIFLVSSTLLPLIYYSLAVESAWVDINLLS